MTKNLQIDLKGQPVTQKIKEQIRAEFKSWAEKGFKPPHLTVLLVGDDPASHVYVNNKKKACDELGFTSEVKHLPVSISEAELIEIVKSLNASVDVDGILIQLPLPAPINERHVLDQIDPYKDVDCLTVTNLGAMLVGDSIAKPCTPSGIIEILKYYQIPLQGKNVAVVGRSLIVGTPLAQMLSNENATVTLFHSKSENVKEQLKHFDIVCVAIGKSEFFDVTDFKKDSVVIDVGIHRHSNNTLTGDVKKNHDQLDWLKAKTPVPGGVGPTTIAMLMKNTFALAYRRRLNSSL